MLEKRGVPNISAGIQRFICDVEYASGFFENASSVDMPAHRRRHCGRRENKKNRTKVKGNSSSQSISSSSLAESAFSGCLASCSFHRLLTWSASRLGKTRSKTSEYQLAA